MNRSWHATHPMPARATTAERLAWHLAHNKHCACRPMPANLAAMVANRRHARSTRPLRPLLVGGDRRSVARSSQAHRLVLAQPDRVRELAALATDSDWLVSMRALDLLEKLVHEHPEWVQPYRRVFIGPLAESDKWELHLQIVRALPFLRWTARQRTRVVAILRRDLEHPQLFVKAWALDSLARLVREDRTLMPVVRQHLAIFARSGRPALATRAREIRRRLARAGQRL